MVETPTNWRVAACALDRQSGISSIAPGDGLAGLKVDKNNQVGACGEGCSSDRCEFLATYSPANVAFLPRLPGLPESADYVDSVDCAAAARCNDWRQRLHERVHLIHLEHVLARAHFFRQ